jgi:hypothetical protein
MPLKQTLTAIVSGSQMGSARMAVGTRAELSGFASAFNQSFARRSASSMNGVKLMP